MDVSWVKMYGYRKQGLFVDVNFSVGGKDFKAHKMVLSAQSAVFEAMFTSGLDESRSGQVNIIDIKPDVFEAFLSYFYTHTVSDSDLSTHLEGLLYCADKYAVTQLMDECENHLERNVTLIRRLFLADLYRLTRVKVGAAMEIGTFGWDRLSSGDWFDIFANFRLTTELLNYVMPSCLEKKWTITPDMWCPTGVKTQSYINMLPFRLRNNGLPCEISLHLRCKRKTIRCSIGYHPQSNSPKVVELSFEFSIGNEAHFCGKGNVWWDLSDIGTGLTDEFQDIFEHTFSSGDPVKRVLELNLTLKQWSPLELQSHARPTGFESGEPDIAVLHVAGETFEVDKAFIRRESDFFKKLTLEDRNSYEIQVTNVDAFRKMRNYLRTGVKPSDRDVDLDVILCARSLGLSNLLRHCEQIVAQRLDNSLPSESVSGSVDLLIFASDNEFEYLRDFALSYVDAHLADVINSFEWTRLRDRPDLIFTIVRKMLASPDPDWSDGPDSDVISCESEAEVEAIMDRSD